MKNLWVLIVMSAVFALGPLEAFAGDATAICALLEMKTGSSKGCEQFKGSYFDPAAALFCANLIGLKGDKEDAGIECAKGVQNKIFSKTSYDYCTRPGANLVKVVNCLRDFGAPIPNELRSCKAALAHATVELNNLATTKSPSVNSEAMAKQISGIVRKLEDEQKASSSAAAK